MRIAVADLGTNSTRLLVAEVGHGGALRQIERHTTVTRLGEGVDKTGRLAPAAIERVYDALARYREIADAAQAERRVAVATSAVRETANGSDLTTRVRDDLGFDVRVIDGDEEARLTFLGATSARPAAFTAPKSTGDVPAAAGTPSDIPATGDAPEATGAGVQADATPGGTATHPATLVIDIGGGSTEFVTGRPGAAPTFHVSTKLGSVRQTERHLHHDPPRHDELEALADEACHVVADAVPSAVRAAIGRVVAVAGTPTSLAAIDQRLDPYDPERVDGYVLERATCERILAELAVLPLPRRAALTGLHPDRAPTIVAGVAILVEALRLFGVERIEVSEADILDGAALSVLSGP